MVEQHEPRNEKRREYAVGQIGRNPLTEHAFQKLIIDHLVEDNGFVRRTAKTDYDPVRAMDVEVPVSYTHLTLPTNREV